MILFGAAGSSTAAPAPDSPPDGTPYPIAADAPARLPGSTDRVDRRGRAPLPGSTEAGEQRVSRAVEPSPSPAPPPPPPPPPPAPNTGSGSGSEPAGPVPESCSEYSGNRATGCTLLLEHGFSIDQMSCLDNLWTKESGWNHLARNPSSGAYGIPQSLPGDKMASAGSDWQTNPATQIRWGLGYIDGRYGTPCGAWQFFQNNNWY